MTPSHLLEIDEAVSAYVADWSWTERVMKYAGLDSAALAELIACFFPDRRRDGLPFLLPQWEAWRESSPNDYRKQVMATCERRGWDADMSILGIVHLEFLAHAPERLNLVRDYLIGVEPLVRSRTTFHMLDFGCGASNYSDLAMRLWPRVRCTLADVDAMVIDYLRMRYAEFGDRTTCAKLPAQGRISQRSRVQVDHRILADRYDAIILSDVLEHTLDPMAVLTHMLKCLNPRGLLFVSYPHSIEGDWHTPEAYALRPLCMRYLARTCRQMGEYVWLERGAPRLHPKRLALECLAPLERTKAKRFAKRYFQEHGEELIAEVVARTRRSLTVEQLIRSVDA